MNSLTSRGLGSLTRAGLLVAVAGAVFALTPQPASSTVKVCLAGHGCITLGNSCEFWSVPEPYVCFTMGLALTNPRLVRERAGGAALVNDGQSSPIASDAAEALLTNWAERRKREGVDRPLTEAMRREFDSAFRSTDRRVSDRRLQAISRELGLPIETTGVTGSGQQSGAGGPSTRPLRLSRSAATEIEAILDSNRFERETAGFLIQMLLEHQGGLFPGYKKGGGWCWNDDGTFYGSLPCPTALARTDATARRAPQAASPNVQISRSAATELGTFLDRSSMSQETAAILILVLLKHEGGSFPGYRKGGGWCWNDDGTFYGSLPCPRS